MNAALVRHDLALLLIGAQLLIVLLFLRGRDAWQMRLLGAGLMLGVIGYLTQLAGLHGEHVLIRALTRALAISVPYVLFEFGCAVFDVRTVPRWVRGVLYSIPLALASTVFFPEPPRMLIVGLDRAHHVAGIGLTLLLLWHVAYDQRDDLIASRRRYRFWFVGLVALHVMAVLSVELVIGLANTPAPAWLEVINLAAIGVLTVLLALPLFATNVDILRSVEPLATTVPRAAPVPDPLVARLRAHMDAGAYREPGLSIGALAAAIGVAEHRLRKLINRELGYRNFTDFVNAYRLPAAQAALADPALASRPVLSIALDVGFASIGPFNRAFRKANDCTPTEYRRRALADSEKT